MVYRLFITRMNAVFILGTLSFQALCMEIPYDRIVNKYDINPKTCSPKLTPSENSHALSREVACFATDNIRILHVSGYSFDALKKKLEPLVQTALNHIRPFIEFSTYDAREKKYVNHLIFCQEHDELSQKNSLLLALYLLQISNAELSLFDQTLFPSTDYRDSSSHIPDSLYNKIKALANTKQTELASAIPIVNEYLVASLLGISDQNIKFLYQRHYFISIDNPLHIDRPTAEQEANHTGIWYDPLETWPKEQREAFKKYTETSEGWNINFHAEKNAAKEWLSKYSSLSRAELRAGVDLLTSISSWHNNPKTYAKKPHVRKILDSSLKLLNLIGTSYNVKPQQKNAKQQKSSKNNEPKKAWIPKEDQDESEKSSSKNADEDSFNDELADE